MKSAQLSSPRTASRTSSRSSRTPGSACSSSPTAKSQRYFPRYGINSASGFQALIDTGVTDGQQLHGTVGFGWLPGLDLPSKFNPDNGRYSNSERHRCLAVFKARHHLQQLQLAGHRPVDLRHPRAAEDDARQVPDQVTFASFIRTVGSLGTAFQPAGNLGIDLRPNRHDPTSRAYHWRYFSDCECFHYEGSIRTIP